MSAATYKLIRPSVELLPVLAHVPHASTTIPPGVRDLIALDDAALLREVVRLTDWEADHLFDWVVSSGGTMFVNKLSRLVLDPERFVDDAEEPMARVGQGVVYTRTTDGETLAVITPSERADRITRLYEPYHRAFEAAVTGMLERLGRAIILDCHSFPSIPLPSDSDQSPDRPDICIGTDSFHTPKVLVEELESRFAQEGLSVGIDAPYAGTIVPLRYLGSDRRVSSVMIEIRRGLYCDEATGERSADFESVRAMIERVVSPALATAIGEGIG